MDKINWKAAWAWLCGFTAGPLAILVPYISEWNWKLPNEVKGSLVLSILVGLGLVQMRRPSDHADPQP